MEIQLHHHEEGREVAGMPLTFMCQLNRIWCLSTCVLLNSILMKTNTLDNSYIMNVFSKIIMLHADIKHYLKSFCSVNAGRIQGYLNFPAKSYKMVWGLHLHTVKSLSCFLVEKFRQLDTKCITFTVAFDSHSKLGVNKNEVRGK